MSKKIIPLISVLVLALLCGGIPLLKTVGQNMWKAIKYLFPVFAGVGKMALEDYLTSPYFITGIIMVVASAFGIWFGKRKGKILYLIVSIICEVASLISILIVLHGLNP